MVRYSLSFEVEIDDYLPEADVEDLVRSVLKDANVNVQEYMEISEVDY